MFLSLRDRFVLLAGLAYIVLEVFSAPIRMGLSMTGLSILIYLPKGLMGLATLWICMDEPLRRGFSSLRVFSVLLIGTAFMIGLLYGSVKQAFMGMWVLLPFWYGLAAAGVILSYFKSVSRAISILWAMATAGVLINYSITFPWEGYMYSIGGVEVEGAREWWSSGGTKRLSGFARTSFDAAVQIQLTAIIAAVTTSSRLKILLLWLITGLAITLTTSKGVMLVYAVCTPLILFARFIPELLFRTAPLVIGSVGLGLPLSALAFDVTLSTQMNATLYNALFSFYDRLNQMWPDAWVLLFDHGNPVFGRGIGGIGTAQVYFEPLLANAADNIFIYWFVVFGWLALPGFIYLLLRSTSFRPLTSTTHQAVFALFLASLVYGMTTNIVENAAFAIACGLGLRAVLAAYSQPRFQE